jgi:hypothetical protein
METFSLTGLAHIDLALKAMTTFAAQHELEIVECREVDGVRGGTDYEMWVVVPGHPELLCGICLFASRGPAIGYVGTAKERRALDAYLTGRGVGDLGIDIRFPL